MGPPFLKEEGSNYYWSLPLYWRVTNCSNLTGLFRLTAKLLLALTNKVILSRLSEPSDKVYDDKAQEELNKYKNGVILGLFVNSYRLKHLVPNKTHFQPLCSHCHVTVLRNWQYICINKGENWITSHTLLRQWNFLKFLSRNYKYLSGIYKHILTYFCSGKVHALLSKNSVYCCVQWQPFTLRWEQKWLYESSIENP
jgi:hypothetical protein